MERKNSKVNAGKSGEPSRLRKPPTILNKRLQEIREERNETQQDIANVLGLKESRLVSWYENTGAMPPYEKLVELSKHFNVSLDYLFGVSDVKTSTQFTLDEKLGLGDEAFKKLQELAKEKSINKDSVGLFAVDSILKYGSIRLFEDIGTHLEKFPINGTEFFGTDIDRTKYSDDIRQRLTEEYILTEEIKNLLKLIQSARKSELTSETLKQRIQRDIRNKK